MRRNILFLAAALALFTTSCLERNFSQVDKDIVLTVSDINALGSNYPVQGEVFEKFIFFGQGELDYKYSAPKGKHGFLYTSTLVTFKRSADKAKAEYGEQKSAFNKEFGAGIVPRKDGIGWGEDEFFAQLNNDQAKAVGTYYIARKGKIVVFYVTSGVYFGSADSFFDLVKPKLNKLEATYAKE